MVLGARHEVRLRSAQLARDVVDRAERLVVAVALARQQRVQRVVERVLPLAIVAPLLDRAQVADLHLADHEGVADALLQLGADVQWALVVEDCVHGVEAETVDLSLIHI